MRLVTFQAGAGPELGAVIAGERIVPLTRAVPAVARDMTDLIARWSVVEGDVRRIAAEAAQTVPLAEARLLAPVARPGKIMAIGLNYADHVAETGGQTPTHQIWFCKQPTAVNPPFAPVQIPRGSHFVDYEAELVAVIGTGGRHISAEDAPAAVFGWCCGDDVTERAWQQRTSQWVLGKSFDTHAPFGPWITTADEVADPHALSIRCLVNGEVRQDSNTANLVFDVWAQIAELTQVMTLEAGDLIFTGTPGGVGAAMNPRRFLAGGDVVRVEIEGLGAIEHRFEPEP